MIRTDSEGNKLWDKTFGGAEDDSPYKIVELHDGGFAVLASTASFPTGNVWLLKIDSKGNSIWDKLWAGRKRKDKSGEYGCHIGSMVETQEKAILLCGWIASYVENDVQSDVWLIKVSKDGDQVWEKTLGSAKKGEHTGTLIETPDGGFIIAGYVHTRTRTITSPNTLLIKTDKDGNLLWERTGSDHSWDEASFLAWNSDKNMIMAWTGKISGRGEDICLAKTDPEGNRLWEKSFGGKKGEHIVSMSLTRDKGFLLAGWTRSFGAGPMDMLVVKSDEDGEVYLLGNGSHVRPEGYRIFHISGDEGLAYQSTGQEAHMSVELQKAIENWEKEVACSPGSIGTWQKLVATYPAHKRKGLLRKFQEKWKAEPQNPMFVYLYGLACLELYGNAKEAEECFKKALVLDQTFYWACFPLGCLDFIRENYEGARQSFEVFLKYRPDDVAALANLAHCYSGLQRHDQTMELYQKVEKLNPAFSQTLEYLLSLGICHLDKNEPEKAATFFQEALKRYRKNPAVHENLGLAYEKLGDKGLALEHLETAVTLLQETSQNYTVNPYISLALFYLREQKYPQALQTWQTTDKLLNTWQPSFQYDFYSEKTKKILLEKIAQTEGIIRDIKLSQDIAGQEVDPNPILEKCFVQKAPPFVLFPNGTLYVVGSKLLRLAGVQDNGFLVAVNKMPEPHQEIALLAISANSLPGGDTIFFRGFPYKLLFYERNPAINSLSVKKLVPIPEFNDSLALDAAFVKLIESPQPGVPCRITVIAWGAPVGLLTLQEGNFVRGVEGVYLADLQPDYSLSGAIYFEEFHTMILGLRGGNQKVVWPQKFPQQNWNYGYYDFDNDGIPERIVIPLCREESRGKPVPYKVTVLKWTKTGFQMLDPAEQSWQSRDLFIEFQNSSRDLMALERLFSRLAGH